MEKEAKLISNSFDQITRFNSLSIFLNEVTQQPSDRFVFIFYKYPKHFLGPGIFILRFFKHLTLYLCLVKIIIDNSSTLPISFSKCQMTETLTKILCEHFFINSSSWNLVSKIFLL